MKKYKEKSNRWMTFKALDFFRNFIMNHKCEIKDHDVFGIIDDLITKDDFIRHIRNHFPENKLEKMMNSEKYRSRLDFDEPVREILRILWRENGCRKQVKKVLDLCVSDYRNGYATQDFANEIFPQKVAELQKTFDLSDFETDVLIAAAFVYNGILEIEDDHSHRTREDDKITFFAKCLDCERDAVLKAVSGKEKLRRYGCLDEDLDFNCSIYGFLSGINTEPLTSRYFKRQRGEVLPWDYYGDLSLKHGGILKDLIRSGRGNSSVNILLYGAPGTGKTSFARTLANELDMTCYFINQNTESEHANSSPQYRFGALQVCNTQVDPAKSIIVVDEADDMLRSEGGGFIQMFGIESAKSGDKGLLNSVLDTVKTPTVWITNTPAEALDESSRRRFDYSIRFEPLNKKQRLSIWKNNVEKLKLKKLFDDAMLQKFAEQYAVSAGGITLTLQNVAKLTAKKEEVPALVEKLMAPHCELLGIPAERPKQAPAQDYSLKGLNIKGDIHLERIINAVRNFQSGENQGIDRPRMNLLLSGAPGTGKTEFVKYLGQVLDTKVVVRMGSDLLSMYVGGTEQNIKKAFREAEEEKAILFLDEIDGLVQSRENARRSWEISQVNELLHRMENFNGIMIGATNFAANLDPAIMRRFTFKLEFDFLTDEGKTHFFEHFFRTKLSESEGERLGSIPFLTPGDFRTVRQSLFYLGGDVSNADRLSALEQESCVKNCAKTATKEKIGF